MSSTLGAATVHPRWRRVPVAVMVSLAILLVAVHAWVTLHLSIDRLLTFVPDDAFYYAGVARHLARTGRATFDGVNPTNGFHPAWMMLLVMAASFGLGALGIIRAALAGGYVLHVATAAVLFVFLKRGVGTLSAPAVGAVLWLLNPFPLLLVQQGVESSLFVLAAVLFLDRHVCALEDLESGKAPSMTYAVPAALLVWARTDAVLLAILGGLQLASEASKRRVDARAALVRIAWLVAALMTPWVAFSWWTVGTPLQDSAVMKQLWRAAGARIGGDPVGWAVLSGAWFGVPLMWLSGSLYVAPGLLVAKLLVVAGTASAALGLDRDSPWRKLVVLCVAWSLVAGAAYAWGMTDLQVWHFAAPGLALFLVTWVGWARLGVTAPAAIRRGLAGAAVCAVLCSALLATASWYRQPSLYPWQPDIYRSAWEFDRQLPRGAVLGSFGAGIPGTLGPRPVVNLDGLVNHAVVGYWRDHRWNEYLAAAGITHIADDRANLERALRFSSAPVPVTPLATMPLTGWHSGPRTLWRIEARD